MSPRRDPAGPGSPGPEVPVYVISVAAELTGLHPQTLRQYDRLGIVSPGRTGGGGRRYSLRDIELLHVVVELTSAGLGLEGVRRVLGLEDQVAALQARNRELRRRVAELEEALAAAHDLAALAVSDLEHSTARASTAANLPALRHRMTLMQWRSEGPGPGR